MAKGNIKLLRFIEVIVAFIMVFGLGYTVFSNFPRFFIWVVSTLEMSH